MLALKPPDKPNIVRAALHRDDLLSHAPSCTHERQTEAALQQCPPQRGERARRRWRCSPNIPRSCRIPPHGREKAAPPEALPTTLHGRQATFLNCTTLWPSLQRHHQSKEACAAACGSWCRFAIDAAPGFKIRRRKETDQTNTHKQTHVRTALHTRRHGYYSMNMFAVDRVANSKLSLPKMADKKPKGVVLIYAVLTSCAITESSHVARIGSRKRPFSRHVGRRPALTTWLKEEAQLSRMTLDRP